MSRYVLHKIGPMAHAVLMGKMRFHSGFVLGGEGLSFVRKGLRNREKGLRNVSSKPERVFGVVLLNP